MISNPILGVGVHAVGGLSAATCYVPFQKTSRWTWETYWIVQALFAWLIMPLVVGYLTVPELFTVLRVSPPSALITAFVLGAVYGFGGMAFGYAIGHIGYALTYSIAIGLSAVLGTVVPLILNGELVSHFTKPGGMVVLLGMAISIGGVALCGLAGSHKERDLAAARAPGEGRSFRLGRGVALSVFAGVLSAVFGISLEYGQPIADVAARYGAGHFEGNAKLILSSAGCCLTNVIWFSVVLIRRGSYRELVRREPGGGGALARNYGWAILGGSMWFGQFFFYGMAHVRMGAFQFASWVLHMSMLIFFSYLVGLWMKEWKMVSRKTNLTLMAAMATLIASFCVMTWGSVLGDRAAKAAGLGPETEEGISRTPPQPGGNTMQRYGSVIGVKESKLEEYKRLHAAVWPDVLKMIKKCNIRNYSIFLRRMPDGNYYLFSYFEYVGSDFAADMAKMAADPTTQKWWDVCIPCQEPLPDRAEGTWWADMEEVFHCD